MRRRYLVVPLLAAALVVSASPALALDDVVVLPRPQARTEQAPQTPRARAVEALREAEQAMAGRARLPEAAGGPSMTVLLRDVLASYDDLAPSDRDRARRLLARPDDSTPGQPVAYPSGTTTLNDCQVAPTPGSNVCVHWATSSSHAPDLTDSDSDGVPDYVESVRDELNHSWDRIVTGGGYRAPLSDSSSANSGPDGRLDVYLADVGGSGYYGYCTSDDPSWQTSNRISAYCVLDDDYAPAQYGTAQTPLDDMRVTAVHEFFHAVQFAYDYLEDAWLMEASSAWVEDEVYDSINDNRQYLANSPLSHPGMPMDYSDESYLGQYGAWIFLRYLSERFPAKDGTGLPVVIRKIWERAASPTFSDWGDYSLQAIVKELRSRGVVFSRLFQQFAVANRRPARFYEEGKAYKAAPLDLRMTVNDTRKRLLRGTPYHLTSGTVRVTPGKKLAAKTWKTRVVADLPKRSSGYGLAVTVFHRSGKVQTTYVKLDASGDGSVRVPFGRKKVKYVEVTFTNASTRYDCWQDPPTSMSCGGVSKDDGRTVKVTLKASR